MLKDKIKLIICSISITAIISSCSSSNPPINTNCIVISSKKVQNKSYAPHEGTKNGLIVGVGSGALIGGGIGIVTGIGAGTVVALFTGSAAVIPVFALGFGVVGVAGGALIGTVIGGTSGYIYDNMHAKNGYFLYNVACGNANGSKFYTIQNNKLEVESSLDVVYINVTQAEYKPIESNITVNLFSDNGQYYIESQTDLSK